MLPAFLEARVHSTRLVWPASIPQVRHRPAAAPSPTRPTPPTPPPAAAAAVWWAQLHCGCLQAPVGV
jgi:hypothetical protein